MSGTKNAENRGVVRCMHCQACACVEFQQDEQRVRIGRITLENALPEYFITDQLIHDCQVEDEQLKPQVPESQIDNSSAVTNLYFATLSSLFPKDHQIEYTDGIVGRLSEEYIFDIFSDPNLCPWAVDAVISRPNAEEDRNGIDITVTISTELAELLGQKETPQLHVQVKTSPPSVEEFYGLAKTLTQSMDGIRENGRPDLHAAAKRWAELRLLFLVGGAGERHPSQVVYEMTEQLKQLIAIHNPTMTDLEISFRCNAIAPPPEKAIPSTRFGTSNNVLRDTYENHYQPIILFLKAMRQEMRNESGQAWSDLISYLQSSSHSKTDQSHKKSQRRKALTARQQSTHSEQSRKGDSRNSRSHYNGFHGNGTGR